MAKTDLNKTISVDEELANHLKKAEDHLIAALELFSRQLRPDRGVDYINRLRRAQEAITWLLREELVRIRGPIKVTAKLGKKKVSK
jgi:hypothetical protein